MSKGMTCSIERPPKISHIKMPSRLISSQHEKAIYLNTNHRDVKDVEFR